MVSTRTYYFLYVMVWLCHSLTVKKENFPTQNDCYSFDNDVADLPHLQYAQIEESFKTSQKHAGVANLIHLINWSSRRVEAGVLALCWSEAFRSVLTQCQAVKSEAIGGAHQSGNTYQTSSTVRKNYSHKKYLSPWAIEEKLQNTWA